jgi:hypothetical protein
VGALPPLCTQMEQSMFSWQGPWGITGEAGHPREPPGLEAKVPLGLAVTTLLRGKQTQRWGRRERKPQTTLLLGRGLCQSHSFTSLDVSCGNSRTARGRALAVLVRPEGRHCHPTYSHIRILLTPGRNLGLAGYLGPPNFCFGKLKKFPRFCPDLYVYLLV